MHMMHFREAKKILERHGELYWVEKPSGWYGLLDTGGIDFDVYELPRSTDVFFKLYDKLYNSLLKRCEEIESSR